MVVVEVMDDEGVEIGDSGVGDYLDDGVEEGLLDFDVGESFDVLVFFEMWV